MSTVAYKCINCGGPLEFNPAKQMFSCEYCRSDFTEKELKDHFGELDEKLNDENNKVDETQTEDDEFGFGGVLFSCPNCGAEVVTDETTAATECVYCHSPVVLSGRLAGDMKPNLVIPFGFTEKDAKEKFYAMCKKKWFLPKDFVSDAHIEQMKGVYYPYWLVDSDKAGSCNATGKKYRTWRSGDYEYKETKTYSISRMGNIAFQKFPQSALSKEDHHMMKFVNPYDNEALTDFSMSYLSGFQAEKRDTERADVQEQVDKELLEYSKKIFKDTMSQYDSVTLDNIQMNTVQEDWKYALFPVWLMSYKYKDKQKIFAINGQTGKTYGELPCSLGKLALFGAGLFVVLSAIIFGLGYCL